MIGEKEVIGHLIKNQPFEGIFVMVGCYGEFNPKEQTFIRSDEYLLPNFWAFFTAPILCYSVRDSRLKNFLIKKRYSKGLPLFKNLF
jgi:hypothetical protein